jgi:hypothetical protein
MAKKKQLKGDQSEPVAPMQLPASTEGLSWDQAYALGKQLREACPRRSHAVWKASQGRPDPVHLVLKAEEGRMSSGPRSISGGGSHVYSYIRGT